MEGMSNTKCFAGDWKSSLMRCRTWFDDGWRLQPVVMQHTVESLLIVFAGCQVTQQMHMLRLS